MKKLIITVTLIFIAITSVNSQTLSGISSSNNKITLKDKHYTSFSIGTGISTFNLKKDELLRYGVNGGMRHQFSQLFYLEGKFDLIFRKNYENQQIIIALIPQWCIIKSKLFNFIFGVGLELWIERKEGGAFLPLANTKFEINLSDDFFIFPELRYPPYMASINIGFRIPYQGFK